MARDLHTALNTVDQSLAALDKQQLCPGAGALAKLNASLR
jgi:2-oxoglutarate ferredoxin oxidoreductase subunit beta